MDWSGRCGCRPKTPRNSWRSRGECADRRSIAGGCPGSIPASSPPDPGEVVHAALSRGFRRRDGSRGGPVTRSCPSGRRPSCGSAAEVTERGIPCPDRALSRDMCAVGFFAPSGGRRTVGPGARGGATGRDRPRRGPENPASGLRARAKCAGGAMRTSRPAGRDRGRFQRNPPLGRCRPKVAGRTTSASVAGAPRAPDPTRAPSSPISPSPRACASGTCPAGSAARTRSFGPNGRRSVPGPFADGSRASMRGYRARCPASPARNASASRR